MQRFLDRGYTIEIEIVKTDRYHVKVCCADNSYLAYGDNLKETLERALTKWKPLQKQLARLKIEDLISDEPWLAERMEQILDFIDPTTDSTLSKEKEE